jgi:hypothetical protein
MVEEAVCGDAFLSPLILILLPACLLPAVGGPERRNLTT